ncbi:hypothetical protein ACFYO2_34550 [Streptomyces sp. NPDC006602]|uniref:hypothetical protein n=1 Tax=Streptomyces sp. NPDC006602 TaxID=3364751 RepID=UPI003679606A
MVRDRPVISADLPEALVRKRKAELIETCRQTNTQPSVRDLVRQLGLSTTTFRRRLPDIVREPGILRSTPSVPAPGPSEHDRLVSRNAKPRRRNQELTSELAPATAQIQHLARTTAELYEVLENVSKITNVQSKMSLR